MASFTAFPHKVGLDDHPLIHRDHLYCIKRPWRLWRRTRGQARRGGLPGAAPGLPARRAQRKFCSSCMDLPAMMICLSTGLRKDTMVCCLPPPKACSLPELALVLSLSLSSLSVRSDTLYSV